MKTIVKRLARDEKGAALVMVLILLLISGLIIGPLLSYMGTGLITGEVYEKRTYELYASDAGVEDAVWKIQHNEGNLPCSLGHSWSYNITNEVNGKSVEITITYAYEDEQGVGYFVESTATGDGSGTQIDAYIIGTSKYGDYSSILDNVVTSLGKILTYGKVNIDPPEGENGPVEYYEGSWPTAEELADWYWEDVKDTDPYSSSTLDVKDYAEIGPFYRDGTLAILNTGATDLTLQLNGTVYITGDTKIGNTNQDFTLDLNSQTIFVESSTTGAKNALEIGGKCTIEGPGVIIAVGNIYFAPKGDVGGDGGPVFILSVEGSTHLQPSGDFYGAVAGNVTVAIKSGTGEQNISYPDEEGWYEGFNFPIGDIQQQQLVYSIYSWEVIPLWRE